MINLLLSMIFIPLSVAFGYLLGLVFFPLVISIFTGEAPDFSLIKWIINGFINWLFNREDKDD